VTVPKARIHHSRHARPAAAQLPAWAGEPCTPGTTAYGMFLAITIRWTWFVPS
jgi:hypothetical protein